MQLSLESDAHLLGCLAQDSLLGMGVSGMEGVDVDRSTSITGLRSGRKCSIVILIIKCTKAIRIQNV